MPSTNRERGRNVHIFDARDRDTELGGLVLPATAPEPTTRRTFSQMIRILVVVDGPYHITDETGTRLPEDQEPPVEGNFYITPEDADASLVISQEPVIVRSISLSTGARVRAFAESVRTRDQACVISGTEVYNNNFIGFQTAHIFPLSHERCWIDHQFSRWTSIMPSTGGAINSVQNGLLLRSDCHQLFDSYFVSINPDDDFRVVWFCRYGSVNGRKLPDELLQDARRPAPELLRWHFRQAVFANMRGAGEPDFEHDFPPYSDRLGTIRDGPRAAEMMEAELFGRFALQMDLYDTDTICEAMENQTEKEARRQGLPEESSDTDKHRPDQ